jgi:hypothetical protein
VKLRDLRRSRDILGIAALHFAQIGRLRSTLRGNLKRRKSLLSAVLKAFNSGRKSQSRQSFKRALAISDVYVKPRDRRRLRGAS